MQHETYNDIKNRQRRAICLRQRKLFNFEQFLKFDSQFAYDNEKEKTKR